MRRLYKDADVKIPEEPPIRGEGAAVGAPPELKFSSGEYWGAMNVVLMKRGRFKQPEPMITFMKFVDENTSPNAYLEAGVMLGVPKGVSTADVEKMIKYRYTDPKAGDLAEGIYLSSIKEKLTDEQIGMFMNIYQTEKMMRKGIFSQTQREQFEAAQMYTEVGGAVGRMDSLDERALWRSWGITSSREEIDSEIKQLQRGLNDMGYSISDAKKYNPEYHARLGEYSESISKIEKQMNFVRGQPIFKMNFSNYSAQLYKVRKEKQAFTIGYAKQIKLGQEGKYEGISLELPWLAAKKRISLLQEQATALQRFTELHRPRQGVQEIKSSRWVFKSEKEDPRTMKFDTEGQPIIGTGSKGMWVEEEITLKPLSASQKKQPVSYTHLRAHEPLR